ncbi:MAG TPA: cytochrome c biogenesis protein CcsA [Myxococcota bacterium]|nr:cytochrome c biogenesis protein CcsA [Myxococcota bacterium]
MSSTALYNWSTAGYLVSLAIFAFHVVNTRRLLLRAGVLLVALSFLVQTLGMVFRWVEAGFLEVTAAEKAVGQHLSGWSWFVVFTQHPPWSNLYEIMIYMSWGIIIVTLACELKWQLAWVRQVGIILALMALGMAALNDATIKPLVPALKSWWIMIHVISASIAYASGALAAFICLFALMKDGVRVKDEALIGYGLLFMAILLFALGGGYHLLTDHAYYVKLLAHAGDSVVNVVDMTKEKSASYLVPMPGVGVMIEAFVLIHVACGSVLLFRSRRPGNASAYIRSAMLLCFLSVMTLALVMLFHDMRATPVTVFGGIAHHLAPVGPWFISFKSHPWSFGLVILAVLIEGVLLLHLFWPRFFTERLPDVSALEGAAYKAISLSFFLMTVVLITGALWAHYAWGRYWAWDPKETGALSIWITYAIYLHARRTAGLAGPFASVIGVCGFFVIIVGFLGVNLGLFADGLHTYGNS